jgi:eukaryotic-like serine/threonine-protein kinase
MPDTLLGTTLGGRYRLDAQIAQGGMSTVYRAFDTVLERPVAIKLMHREIASDSQQLERFRREARAVAQLSHPHIVTIVDAGEEQHPDGTGAPYIVFEYVDGETLKALIRRSGPLEVTQAIAYAIEIARALGAAHEHHIVHRDVKPQNVLLGGQEPNRTAKITDFGIARTLTEQGLTLDGRVLGTTDYVSPEQAVGEQVTGQSDIYSLGIVLYEMLTGGVPFRGETPVAVAMRHVREEVPDVQLRRPELSAATAAVVDRATARDRSLRYPDIPSLLADLEDALAIEAARAGQATGEVTTVLRTLPGPTRRRLPWRLRHPARWLLSLVVLGGLVALALALIAGHTRRGTGVPPDITTRPGLSPVSLQQTAAHSYNPFGHEREDPNQVAAVVDGDPNTAWSTEHYLDNVLAGKPGTGIYLDAAPGLAARAIEIQTPTPGFAAGVYASNGFEANATPSQSVTALGWTQLAPPRTLSTRTTIALDSDGALYRYYLLWITRLPPDSEFVEISEITLFK